MNTHGTLTEHSRTSSLNTPIGKGREGNRKGIGGGREARCRDLICGCSNSDFFARTVSDARGKRVRRFAAGGSR